LLISLRDREEREMRELRDREEREMREKEQLMLTNLSYHPNRD
jgi:hypothetical protein